MKKYNSENLVSLNNDLGKTKQAISLIESLNDNGFNVKDVLKSLEELKEAQGEIIVNIYDELTVESMKKTLIAEFPEKPSKTEAVRFLMDDEPYNDIEPMLIAYDTAWDNDTQKTKLQLQTL